MHTPIPFTPTRTSASWMASSALRSIGDAYVHYLVERGYAPSTTCYYFSAVAHFSHWLSGQQTHMSSVAVSEDLVSRFLSSHIQSCDCAMRCVRSPHTAHAALGHLLKMLRSQGRCVAQRASPTGTITAELSDFDNYLADIRGLSPVTRSLRARHVRRFLEMYFSRDPVQISSLAPADVTRFIAHHSTTWSPASIGVLCTSLRSYLNFRASKSDQTAALIASLPQIAQWRLRGLPKQLTRAEVKQLLRAFNLDTPTGRRDYAMTRCIADLGLRSAEVARLQLEDMDWREGTLAIRSKGQRIDLLPLPQDTGRAIAQYLQDGRPPTSCRELFVRHRPPLNAPATAGIVRNAVRYAAARCGLADRVTGPHILRHTLASQLVQRGAPLKDIADLLRHRSLDTTTIYAKVDFPALEQVALPWPGRRS